MPATPWTELTVTATGWTEGFPSGDGSDDFFIDFLFEGTGFFGVIADSYTELSISTTAATELSVAATSWTELTG